MKSLMMLLMTLLLVVSCNNFPTVETVEVCALNVSGNYCRCGAFDFNYGMLRSSGESYNKPLKDCHKNIGMSGPDWIKLVHYIDSIYVWKDIKEDFKVYNSRGESGIMNFDTNSNNNNSTSTSTSTPTPPLTRDVLWHQTPLKLLYE